MQPWAASDGKEDRHPLRSNTLLTADLVSVQVLPPRISMRDFEKVLLRARPTVSKDDLGVFVKFTDEFGEEAS